MQLRIQTWRQPTRPDDVNVLIGSGVCLTDRELFFGPLEPLDIFYEFPAEIRMPQVLKMTGVFHSTSEARRCGWDIDVPPGFSQYHIGKRKRCVTILKIVEPVDVG